jgi:hypothetical protein
MINYYIFKMPQINRFYEIFETNKSEFKQEFCDIVILIRIKRI